MSVNLKIIYKNIINNQNLEENIPFFLNNAVDKYYTCSTVQLSLLYYTYYEMYCDDKELWDNKLLDYSKQLNAIISEALMMSKSGKELEEYVKHVDELRATVTSKMDMITSYSDMFEIYEHVLNRVEYRFKEIDNIEEDEEFAKKVLRFVFNSEDNVQINDLIKEVIGQLPIRITRQKFFDYLRDGLYELNGVQEDTLDTYIYLIRSSATLDIKDDIKEEFPKLWESKVFLENLDFKNITKQEYEMANKLVEDAALFLEIMSTTYYNLMEIINQLYVMLICAPYIGTSSNDDKEQEDAALYIIRSINESFLMDKYEEPTEDILSRFGSLEGFLEQVDYDLMNIEDAVSHINSQHRALVQSLMQERLLNVLLISKDLFSGSIFIELDKKSEEIVNIDRIRKELDKLEEDLSNKFKDTGRMIMRAIMAKTMNKLPVFFNNHTEVMDYVLYSLNKCTDLAEKYACMEIIESMMED